MFHSSLKGKLDFFQLVNYKGNNFLRLIVILDLVDPGSTRRCLGHTETDVRKLIKRNIMHLIGKLRFDDIHSSIRRNHNFCKEYELS